MIVPRHRHSAVARNLVKRRLRELARIRLLPLDFAVDVVIRIRLEAYRALFPELAVDFNRAVIQLIRWHGALIEEPGLRRSTPEPPTSGDT